MFFILHACKHACAQKIYDVKPIIQNYRVCNRRVHGSWQMCARQLADACMPVRNAHAKIELRAHANCKPRTAE